MNRSLLAVFMLVLAAANMLGFVIGLVFYYPQLASNSPVFWIFIPDCPLYVVLACLVYFKVIRNGLLRFIIAAGLLKYALWTEFVLFFYHQYYLQDWLGWVLVIEHIGMALQFALVAGAGSRKYLAIAIGWFLLNDFIDYSLGMHPYVPVRNLDAVIAFAVASSIAVPLAVHAFASRMKPDSFIGRIRKETGMD